MKLNFNLSALLRPLRVVLTVCIFALLLFVQAMPAYSATKSSPTDGEANLLQIEKKSQEAVLSDPYTLDKQIEETSKPYGLNEVQGDADIDKMKRPENSKGAQSIEQKVEKALEAVEGKATHK